MAESLIDNSAGVYYLANLQMESLPLNKPKSSFASIFPDFPKTRSFFMFLKFWNSYFQGQTAITEWLISLFYKVLPLTVMYCKCQFTSKIFLVIKVRFHNSKVKARSFLFIIMGVKPPFSNLPSKETLERSCACLKDRKEV